MDDLKPCFARMPPRDAGHTLAELLIAMVVLGILAGIAVIGIGSWRERTRQNIITSDLQNAHIAMEAARNFGAGYPAATPAPLPSTIQPTKNIVITIRSSTATAYCVEAYSTEDPAKVWKTTQQKEDPVLGNC